MECREELRQAGEPYPRSGCALCGSILVSGWTCKRMKEYEAYDKDIDEELEHLKAQRRVMQEKSDDLLDKLVDFRSKIKALNYSVNKLKRLKREKDEDIQENERRWSR